MANKNDLENNKTPEFRTIKSYKDEIKSNNASITDLINKYKNVEEIKNLNLQKAEIKSNYKANRRKALLDYRTKVLEVNTENKDKNEKRKSLTKAYNEKCDSLKTQYKTSIKELNEKIDGLKVDGQNNLKTYSADIEAKRKEIVEKNAVLFKEIGKLLEQISKIKAAFKIELSKLKETHKNQLVKYAEDQKVELNDFIASFRNKKDVAADIKALKEVQAKEEADFIAKQQSEISSNLSEEELFRLKKKHSANYLIFKNGHKVAINKLNAQVLTQFELTKKKQQIWLDYSKFKQELEYEEYLAEVENNKKIAAITGESIDHGDDEKGNVVVTWFKNTFRDIAVSINEKPSIIFGLLLMFTGIVFGFTISSFIIAANGFTASYSWVGIIVFGLELLGVLNMVNGFGMCKDRRLKSAVSSAIISVAICALSIVWISALSVPEYIVTEPAAVNISRILAVLFIITSIVGTVGSFITYDRHYLKDVKR